jgi:hypothetical protein
MRLPGQEVQPHLPYPSETDFTGRLHYRFEDPALAADFINKNVKASVVPYGVEQMVG